MQKNSKIYVAGHRWLVGSAIVRLLKKQWYTNIIIKTRQELDLLDSVQVAGFFENEKPEYVFLAAAKVGGIVANRDYPADFLYQNLQIQNNVIHQSYLSGVKKLLFLGSSCIYPRDCKQPMKEEYLLSWKLESTNEPYAIAKITWIKMCQSYNRQYWTNFIACMPTNLYGPNDNFDLETSHVLPAMIRKFYEAKKVWKKEVVLWWDWSPMREFLFVDDMAEACLFLMDEFDPSVEENKRWEMFLNIGTGKDVTIKKLAEIVKYVVWFDGDIIWDVSKPNGTPRKLLDVSMMTELGWEYEIELVDGVWISFDWFLGNK